jgi:hypothetical protein
MAFGTNLDAVNALTAKGVPLQAVVKRNVSLAALVLSQCTKWVDLA